MKDVIIIGAGGHAQVILDILKMNENINVIGATALSKYDCKLEVPYLGNDSTILEYNPNKIYLVNGIGSTTLPLKRKEIYIKFKEVGYFFESIIHPSAIISDTVTLGEGVQIMAGCIVQSCSNIGNNVLLNTAASVDHDSLIGDHTHLAPGVICCGNVEIGAGCHIGPGAILVQGAKIGASLFMKARALIKSSGEQLYEI